MVDLHAIPWYGHGYGRTVPRYGFAPDICLRPKMCTVLLAESKSWTIRPLVFGKLYGVPGTAVLYSTKYIWGFWSVAQ